MGVFCVLAGHGQGLCANGPDEAADASIVICRDELRLHPQWDAQGFVPADCVAAFLLAWPGWAEAQSVPKGFVSHDADIDGARIHYTKGGSGPVGSPNNRNTLHQCPLLSGLLFCATEPAPRQRNRGFSRDGTRGPAVKKAVPMRQRLTFCVEGEIVCAFAVHKSLGVKTTNCSRLAV